MKRPSGWMDDGSGGRSQGLLHQKPSYIDLLLNVNVHLVVKTKEEIVALLILKEMKIYPILLSKYHKHTIKIFNWYVKE
jgi:hypothetical protein